MKYPQFVYSFLLLLVFGGCCKLDDSPLRLTATDLELLANEVGDTIRLKDVATDSVYTYVVDSVGASLEPTFEGNVIAAEKSGCASKPRQLEVGKTTFSDNNGGYKFVRTPAGLNLNLRLNNLTKPLELIFVVSEDSPNLFVKYRQSITLNQIQYDDVYELAINNTRILISRTKGLVYVANPSIGLLLVN